MIYIFILLLLLFLSINYDIYRKKRYRDQWYMIMMVVFIIIAGIRFRIGVDTISYLYNFYYIFPELQNINMENITLFRYEPLWVLLNSVVKSLVGKFFIVQLVQASIVNILIFNYIRKHSSYPFFCIFLYFLMDYHWYCMMVMRNAAAMAICLWANDYVLEKKWRKAFVLYGIAGLFHYATLLLMLFIPILKYLRLNKFGALLLISTIFIGYITRSYLEEVISIISFDAVSNKLDAYLENDIFAYERSINYFIVMVIVPAFYVIISLYQVKKHDKNHSLLALEPFVMVGLIFLILRLNIGMLHRYSRAYDVYFIMFYVQCFINLSKTVYRNRVKASYMHSLIIFSPLLFIISYFSGAFNGYTPYYTIIEKKVDFKRECHYDNQRPWAKKLDIYNDF